jgi:Tfp pilus assembly protein PilF
MGRMHNPHLSGLSGVGRSDRRFNWTPPRREPPELVLARNALADHRLADAERHLQRALISGPDCAEVRTLMGLLHEQVGEHHAAYRCYWLALSLDRGDIVAGDGLRRYCQRFGYDPSSKAINPAAADPH